MSRLIAAAENSGREGRGTEPRQETREEQPGAGEGQVSLTSIGPLETQLQATLNKIPARAGHRRERPDR